MSKLFNMKYESNYGVYEDSESEYDMWSEWCRDVEFWRDRFMNESPCIDLDSLQSFTAKVEWTYLYPEVSVWSYEEFVKQYQKYVAEPAKIATFALEQ